MDNKSLKALLNENSDYLVMQSQTKPLVAKWTKYGLLEGIDNEFEQTSMAVMLENQAKRLIAEATSTSGASSSEAWSGVALPLVRRIFGELSAKEFVSVQPMNLPSGLVFFLDFKYSSTNAQPGFTAGTSIFGGTSTARDANFGRQDTRTNGLFGAGRFGFTSNEVSASVALGATGSVTLGMLNNDSTFSALTSSHVYIDVATSSFSNLDVNAIRAMTIANGTATIAGYSPTFTALTGSNVRFIISGSTLGTTNTAVFTWLRNNTQDVRGDFEDLFDGSGYNQNGSSIATQIPSIDLQLKNEPIVAKTKKLKAQWTPEMAQDLNAYHSIDAEQQLTSILSEYISMEIDLEILDMLITNAFTVERWSTVNNEVYTAGANSYTGTWATQSSAFYNDQPSWFQTLGTKMKKVSNRIHALTMRGGANFVVTSPDVATIFDSMAGYMATDRGEKMKFAMGVQKAGTMSNQYDVYINPYMTDNLILMGYRGPQFLETGAVYSPYIPLMMTPLVMDPVTYTPNRGVMTRYAKKMLRPEFYGLVQVKGLNNL